MRGVPRILNGGHEIPFSAVGWLRLFRKYPGLDAPCKGTGQG
jgi:hypothetical protein